MGAKECTCAEARGGNQHGVSEEWKEGSGSWSTELWMSNGRETQDDPKGWGWGVELLAMVVAMMHVDMKLASGSAVKKGSNVCPRACRSKRVAVLILAQEGACRPEERGPGGKGQDSGDREDLKGAEH